MNLFQTILTWIAGMLIFETGYHYQEVSNQISNDWIVVVLLIIIWILYIVIIDLIVSLNN